jgi:hypothetical protein
MKKGQKVMVTRNLSNYYKVGEIVTCIGKARYAHMYKLDPNNPVNAFTNPLGFEQDLSPDEYVLIKTPFMRRLFAQLFNK